MNTIDMNAKTADIRFIITSPSVVPFMAQTDTKLKKAALSQKS